MYATISFVSDFFSSLATACKARLRLSRADQQRQHGVNAFYYRKARAHCFIHHETSDRNSGLLPEIEIDKFVMRHKKTSADIC
ncbi:hypothetical protein PsorP6_004010 [Peronosclerospora sorghi]|uniref:Uncharacterized protein n=2 Tax=Peronosclerospora sorghi TaxID=230839 RepID=A0ACC0VMT3_9STRA|nr:hypothetical protein PsorP6_004007 [Peronosclerospora sorghi]KAI9907662.1 hypothetical protein PsorP6_004010 [Peronosclerospora sorghi]